MRSGLFLPPFHPTDENPTLCLERDMELVVHAERLGFEEAWVGEHHSGGFEIIASPELFIAAVAERTRRIRLGTGVISLPYHHPLTVADRILQLDHQTRGRTMFGVGPGLLPSDAFQMGVHPATTRDRMIESLEAILRLLDGERVSAKTDWFTLEEASCQLRPYSQPRPEFCVASTFTPSGGKLAGQHGLGMLCMAATGGGFDVLDYNWRLARETAAEHGKTMDPRSLRLVGGMHLAETREKALENVRFGYAKWHRYMRAFDPDPAVRESGSAEEALRQAIESRTIVVGTPDDAIAQIRRLQDKQGEFGCFLILATNWANWQNTKASYELFQRYVMPVINAANSRRDESQTYVRDNAERLVGAAADAARKTIRRHKAETAQKAVDRGAA